MADETDFSFALERFWRVHSLFLKESNQTKSFLNWNTY